MASDAVSNTSTITHGIYSFKVTLTFHEDGYDSDFQQLTGPTLSSAELIQLYPLLQRKIQRLAGQLRQQHPASLQQRSALISDAG